MPPVRQFSRGPTTLAVLVAGSVALLLLPWVIGRIAALYPAALPDAPYLDLRHAPLLYLLWPLVFSGSVVLFLAPGAFLVSRSPDRRTLVSAIADGFLVSFGLLSVLGLIASRVSSRPALPFSLAVIAIAFGAWAWRARRGGSILDLPDAKRCIGWLVALSGLAAALTVPIVFWQDLNPDGGEMLNMARSLDWYLVPREPTGRLSGLGLGMVAEAYWAHTFYLLAGLTESAARLPFIFYVPVTFFAILATIETGRQDRLHAQSESVLALQVCVVFVALAYNATYHPYSADMASPAAIDVLAGICLLGMLRAFADRRLGWSLAYAAVGYFARPVALLVCALLIVAQLAIDRQQWRKVIGAPVAAIVLCLVLAATYERGLAPYLGLGLDEPSTGVMGRRLRYLLFGDWARLAYVIVPASLLPLLTLLLFPLQDSLARIWAAAALLFLAFFSCLAFTALHQYLPVVLLSLVVFWRVVAGRPRQSAWHLGASAAAVVALALSAPRSFAVDRSSREIASRLDYRIGDYRDGPLGFRQAFAGKDLLEFVFPPYDSLDPERRFISAPLMFVHYATAPSEVQREPNYLVLPVGETAPTPWTRIAENAAGSVWVRDHDAWQQQLYAPPPTDFRSRALGLPRSSLLALWGIPARRYHADLKPIMESLLNKLLPPRTGDRRSGLE